MEAFGEHLRRWRRRRALSQLELAALAGTSSRHLSFLESGRSSPGREMVLRLAEALAVDGPERDRALEAAGLEPFRRQGVPDDGERALLTNAVGALLDGHDPLPAFALDPDWRLLGANGGGRRLLAALGAAGAGETPAGGGSLLELLIAHADSGAILDWPDVADAALRRGRAELARHSRSTRDLERALARLESVLDGQGAPAGVDGSAAAVMPLRVRAGDETLSLLTMVAQFGGVDYVEVDAPRVELMLPADGPTRRWFERGG